MRASFPTPTSARRTAAAKRRVVRGLVLASGSLALSGCEILGLGRQCDPEYVGLAVFGRVGGSATSPPTLQAQVDLTPPSSAGGATVVWFIESATLKPHTTRAELRDSGDGALLFTFPLTENPASFISVSRGAEPYAWPIPFGDLRARLSAHRGVIELTTNLPDQPLVRLALSSSSDRPGGRAICD